MFPDAAAACSAVRLSRGSVSSTETPRWRRSLQPSRLQALAAKTSAPREGLIVEFGLDFNGLTGSLQSADKWEPPVGAKTSRDSR